MAKPILLNGAIECDKRHTRLIVTFKSLCRLVTGRNSKSRTARVSRYCKLRDSLHCPADEEVSFTSETRIQAYFLGCRVFFFPLDSIQRQTSDTRVLEDPNHGNDRLDAIIINAQEAEE